MNEFSFNIIDAQRQKEGLFWKEQLASLEVAYGPEWIKRGNPAQPPQSKNHQRHFIVPPTAVVALNKIARNRPENIHAVLMAIMQAVFYKYTPAGSSPVLFTPVYATMSREEYDEEVIPVCCAVEPASSFLQLLDKMQQSLKQSFIHRHYPLRYIWNKMQGAAQSYGKAVLVYDRVHQVDGLLLQGAEIKYIFRSNDDQLVLEIEYSDAYHHWYVENAAFHFIKLIAELDTNRNTTLAAINILSPNERERLLYKLNPEIVAAPKHKTVVQCLHEHALTDAGKIAYADQYGETSYAALSQKVNALAAALTSTGVQHGSPVAVLMERSVKMAEIILAIWQAGGVYIPVDIKFPLKRIQLIVQDACGLLITTQAHLDNELPGANFDQVLTVEALITAATPAASPATYEAAGNEAAYIIYTSGSTGVPKGAMVPHAGMVNQLHEKARDLQITDASVVAQTASHVFDISIWQFFTALVKGGATLICSNETVMEPGALISLLQQRRVTHLQVVPSYFVALLESVKNSRPLLSDLKMLVSAGEELRVHQATQWLDLYPQIPILNAYGPTEASIDILHFRVETKPSGFVPIGRPLKNTAIYILDQDMNLCPEGVRGEIAVSGIGTGLGYLNNQLKTSQSFVQNNFDPALGAIIYKTGDIGCWLPDGNIQFFGRRDHQVKIRGFRIELAEIENVLLKNSLVKETVVVVNTAKDGQPFLCAYLRLEQSADIESIRTWLTSQVPAYMVPAHFQLIDAFEKLPSGKINRNALPAMRTQRVEELQPRSEKEQVIAAVWEKLLGIESVQLQDNFFRSGGDSIRAIQLASRLRTVQLQLSIEDIFTYPTVAGMAAQCTSITEILPQETVTGTIPLSPVQQYFFTTYSIAAKQYNQAVMLDLQKPVSDTELLAIASKLTEHHDALRMRYTSVGDRITQENMDLTYPVSVQSYELSGSNEPWKELESIANTMQSGIELETGPLMRIAVFRTGTHTKLLLIIHHLVIDGVSWRILLEDLDILLLQVQDKRSLVLPAKTSSFRSWALALEEYTRSATYEKAVAYWEKESLKQISVPVSDMPQGHNRFRDMKSHRFSLDKTNTALLLGSANNAFNTHPQELLLISLLMAMEKFFGTHSIRVNVEGHGRETTVAGMNINRTLGWFTSIYPVSLEIPASAHMTDMISVNKGLMRRIPNNGFDYLLWKFADRNALNGAIATAPVLFNYLGQFDTDFHGSSFRSASESFGNTMDPELQRTHDLEIISASTQEQLFIQLAYSGQQYTPERMQLFADYYRQSIEKLVQYCAGQQLAVLTPDDLTFRDVSAVDLVDLQKRFDVQDVFTLSSTQEGMLYHALLEPGSLNYFVQIAYLIKGEMQVPVMEKAFNMLLQRHDILRAHFIWEHEQRPLQVIDRNATNGFSFKDVSGDAAGLTEEEALRAYRQADLEKNFDMKDGLLIRLSVVKTGAEKFELVWSFHHILMDGWCTNILAKEFLILYQALLENTIPVLPTPIQYVRYIKWLEQQDRSLAAAYWKNYLHGFDTATVLPLREKVNLQKEAKVKEHILRLDADASAQLQELALTAGVTLYTVIQSAWALLLSFYNNNKEVVFGSVVAGRPAEIEGIESMVGLFINTLPVRVKIDAATRLFDLYQSVQQDALRSNHFDFYPLAKIQSESGLDKELISHILVYENYPLDINLGSGKETTTTHHKVGNLDIIDVTVFEQTNYDLSVIIAPGREMQVKFQYRLDALEEQAVTTMAMRFRYILEQLFNGGDVQLKAIDRLLPEEEKMVRHRFNSTRRQYPLQYNVEELFMKRVKEDSERPAVVYGEESISYGELNRRAEQLAAVLTATGKAGPGNMIGLLMHRSVQTVVAIMGIIKSGAAYVPVSPYLPIGRIEYIIKDSGCELIVCNKALETLASTYGHAIEIETAIAATAPEVNFSAASPDDLIYLIYTSGSTGRPKGVEVTHKNVVNLLFGLNEIIYSSYDAPCRMALISPFDFDASIQHLFGSLVLGHTLFIVEEEARADGNRLMEFFLEKAISISDGTPTHLRLMLETGMPFSPSLKHLLIAGEELPKNLVAEFYAKQPGTKITNLYGPTEACVDASYFHITPDALNEWLRIPIGKPLPNQQIYILDKELQFLPLGITGEIFIGGEGVSKGYRGLETLTRERFIANPYRPGERLYRTGDLGKWVPGGNLVFAGRADNQVKIRGFRIEPGEIEYILKELKGIQEAIVVAKEQNGSVKLTAFYTATTAFTISELRAFAEVRLPYYMVPSYFIRIDKIPVTNTNKTDIQALLSFQQTEDTGRELVSPANQTEEILAGIWKNILQLKEVGIHDNFFEAGGNSIDLVRVYGQMKAKMNFEGTLVKLIEFPTIATMASHLLVNVDNAVEPQEQDRIRQSNEKKLSQRAIRKMAMDTDNNSGN